VGPEQFTLAAIISSDSPIRRKRIDLSFLKNSPSATVTASVEGRIHIIITLNLIKILATLPANGSEIE